MPLITIVIVLVVVGFLLLWIINTYVPMASPIKAILNGVVIIAVVLWVLSLFGIIPAFHINLH